MLINILMKKDIPSGERMPFSEKKKNYLAASSSAMLFASAIALTLL